MNPNYMHTITLYNCLKACDSADKKDHWYRIVLNDCYYKAAISRADSGTMNAGQKNVYVVRIPADERYRHYPEWAALPDDLRGRYFTMSLDDVVIYGNCLEEITGESGKTAVQITKYHKPGAFKVTACSDNTRAPVERHYRLGG